MIAPCPNKALIRMYENAFKPIQWCWNLSIFWQRDFSRSYAEHDELLKVYRDRDGSRYESLARKHIHDASERFRKEYGRRKQTGEDVAPLK